MAKTVRTATIKRNTTETQIALKLTIDGQGVETGEFISVSDIAAGAVVGVIADRAVRLAERIGAGLLRR